MKTLADMTPAQRNDSRKKFYSHEPFHRKNLMQLSALIGEKHNHAGR